MRRAVLSFVIIMAACGTGSPATTAPDDVPREGLSAPEPSRPPGERATTTSKPQPAVTTPPMLDAAAVLLTELDFGEPWTESFRMELSPGWDPGPAQTDCAAYDAFEAQQAVPSARAGWWRDGYNFNHESLAYPDEGQAQAAITAMRELLEQCEKVKWLEGGAFNIAPLDVGPDAVGMEFLEDGGHVQWFAFLQRSNIVSRVHAVSFGEIPLTQELHLRDFGAVVAQAHAQLLAAPEFVAIEPPPPTTTSMAVVPPESSEAEGFVYAPLLLDASDFAEDVVIETGRTYSGETGTEDCPSSESFATIADWMEVHALATDTDLMVLHEVGFPADGTDPAPAVRDLAALGECDWGEEGIRVESGLLEGLPQPVVAAAYTTVVEGRTNVAVAVVALDDGVVSRFLMIAPTEPEASDLMAFIRAFLDKLPAFDSHVAECTRAQLLWNSGEFTDEVASLLDRCEGIIDYLVGIEDT